MQRRLGDRADLVEHLVQAPLLSPSRETYRRYLSDLYGFVFAVEANLVLSSRLESGFLQPRIKSGLIASDLMTLGSHLGHERVSRQCDVPGFEDALEGLAWLWVIDRMVGRFGKLRPKLQRTLPVEICRAGSFLRTYQGAEQRRWAELGRAIDRRIGGAGDRARLYSAVAAALDCLEAWLLPVMVPRAVLASDSATDPSAVFDVPSDRGVALAIARYVRNGRAARGARERA